jgi:hypothetical protein
MKKRAFFLLSLSLAILSLSAQLWAMGFTSRSLYMRTRAITGRQEERAQGIAEAKNYLRQFPMFYYSGWAFAASSVALLVVSLRRREPAKHAIPFGLLGFYLILQLLLI